MGGFSAELTSPISAERMFKAAILDGHNLAPKARPEHVVSATIIEGDGGVGSVKHIVFTSALPIDYVKEQIDLLDKENLEYKYTVIEGAEIGKKLEWSSCHVKIEATGNGGSVIKISAEYKTLSGVDYTEDEKHMKGGIVEVFKTVETCLITKPDAYA